MKSIQINSVVQLKSGGPLMTVSAFATKLAKGNRLTAMQVEDDSRVICQWFEQLTLRGNTFDRLSLNLLKA